VLCPTTEGNLGDGLFNADAWMGAGGAWGIGTDSHVSIDPREELRWFEYGRRLARQKRSLTAAAAQPHPGAALWLQAAGADARGGGARTGKIETGWQADWLVLDAQHPNLAGRTDDFLFDSLVFASTPGPSPIVETWVSGRRLTQQGRHPLSDQTAAAFAKVVTSLASG
jgi:formimidoylglutamate deiminase